MTLTIAPSTPFTADALFGPSFSGLATVAVQIVDSNGAVVQARTTSGVAESPTGSGDYVKNFTASPSTAGTYRLAWDTGGGTPQWAFEDLIVTPGPVVVTVPRLGGASPVILYKGNSSPTVTDTITIGGVAQDLTGCTVRFRARDPRTNTVVLDVGGAQVVIANQTTNKGGVTYTPNSTDTAVAYQVPPLVGWWNITLPSGAVQDTPETFNVFIRDHAAPRSTDLCTVTDVRQALRISADQTRNDQIQSFITRGSPMIMRWCDREFAPASIGLTRTFRIDISGGDLVVELNPYDLRTATTVTLSPEGAATVLTSTQYSLEPIPNPDGTYKRVRLSPFLGGIISPTALVFGYSKLAITGNWGFATVPDDVVQAATVIIASWIDVSQGQYQGTEVFSDLPRLTLPNADARSAWATLGAYKRMVV